MALTAVPGGDGVPAEPDWSAIYNDILDLDLAHEEWGIVVREMTEAQTVAVVNGHAIMRLVMFRVQYERSARNIAENGAVLKAKRTGVPQYNPHWPIMRQADEAIRVLEAELGLAPVRRGKASKVQRGKKAVRAADSYLKPVQKK